MRTLLLILACAASGEQDRLPSRVFPLRGVAPGEHVVTDAAGYAALLSRLPKDMAAATMKSNPVHFDTERLVVVARTGSDGGWEVTFGEVRRSETEIVVGYWFWRTPKAAVTVPTTVATGLVLERSELPLRFEQLAGEPPAPKK